MTEHSLQDPDLPPDTVSSPAEDPDAESNIQNGRIIIFILAGLVVISAAILYNISREPEVFYIHAPVAVIYVALGIFYYRQPYVISIIALSVYLTLQFVNLLVDPSSLTNGIIFKFVIVFGLIRCIRFARYYKRIEKPKETGLLDDDMG